MPKVYTDSSYRAVDQFSDFVRGSLARGGRTQQELADCLGIPQQSVSNRIDGKTEWKLSEVVTCCNFFETSITVDGRGVKK